MLLIVEFCNDVILIIDCLLLCAMFENNSLLEGCNRPCSEYTTVEQGRIFIMIHLLRHLTSVYTVSSKEDTVESPLTKKPWKQGIYSNFWGRNHINKHAVDLYFKTLDIANYAEKTLFLIQYVSIIHIFLMKSSSIFLSIKLT